MPYRGLHPGAAALCTALLRNREEVDDLVHDCLVRALDKLHTRRDDAEMRAWLFAIMHNLFISQLRRQKSRPAGEPMDESHEATVRCVRTRKPTLHFRDLVEALNRLPVEQRSVLLLVSVEDLPTRRRHSVLGMPIGTVMSRLARGRERSASDDRGRKSRPVLRRVK